MKPTCLASVAMLVLALGRADGASIFINNHDFETGGLADGEFSNNPGVIPTGWSAISGITGAFFGYFNPVNDAYVGTDGSGTVGTMSGANVFYFGSATGGQGIEQVLSNTFAANTDYTLTVALGSRLNNTDFTAHMTINLMAGSTIIATSTVRNDAFDGSFADYSLEYTYSEEDSHLLGEALRIQFIENNDEFTGEVDIDNVRLTAIPEPTSAGLVGASLMLACLRRSRRRKA